MPQKAEHWRSLRAGKHASPYLQRAWSKYGGGSFVFSVVEAAPELRLLGAEQYWLDFTGCCNPEVGFNMAASAVSPMKGRKLSTEGRARASAAKFKMWEDSARRKRMAAVQRDLWKDPAHRAKVAATKAGLGLKKQQGVQNV